VRLTGAMSIAIHMRDLTAAEKDAHASATIARLRT
jgi:hypothetical protein